MRHTLRKRRNGPLRWFSRLAALWTVVCLPVLLVSCDLNIPIPTVPYDEHAVETRVAGTLTALAPATATPTETMPPATPTPTEGAPLATPTPTDTALPPTPTETALPPTPTQTPPPPTPTNTRVVPLTTPTSTATRTPTNVPLPVVTDWRGEYYANRDLAGTPARVRNDVAVSFNWGQGAPVAGVPADNFSVRWTRHLGFEGATYRFYVYVDDGVRLWVDDELILNAWYDSSAHTVTKEYPMVQGTHRIRVEYYERSGDALVQLWWERIDSFPDWKGEYWPNRDLSGPRALVRNDRNIDFDWGPNAPASGLPRDSFSVRWTRTVDFDGGTYRFRARVDDGVRIWVDDQRILSAWYDSQPHEVSADYALARGAHRLRVEYYEHSGGAEIRVWWDKVGSPSYPDWKGEYWSNRSLRGNPALARNDQDIDFNWGPNAPASGLPGDDFSARWSRKIDFETGVYRFRARADDGIRFYLSGNLVLDEWHDSRGDETYSVDQTLSGQHQLIVEYYERGGDAHVKFWWTRVRGGPSRD